MLDLIKGKKTYILVVLGALTILVNFIAGDTTFMEFITSTQFIELLGILGIGTLRAAVSSTTK